MSFHRFYNQFQATMEKLRRATLHRLGVRQGGLVPLTDEQKAKITEWRPSFTRSHEPLATEFREYLRHTEPDFSKVNTDDLKVKLKMLPWGHKL
jgi:hypothetical protein